MGKESGALGLLGRHRSKVGNPTPTPMQGEAEIQPSSSTAPIKNMKMLMVEMTKCSSLMFGLSVSNPRTLPSAVPHSGLLGSPSLERIFWPRYGT